MKKYVLIKHLYLCEMYLMCGKIPFVSSGTHIPDKYKKKYIDEIQIEYNRKLRRYVADYSLVWNYYLKHYSTELDKRHIRSYDQLIDIVLDKGGY